MSDPEASELEAPEESVPEPEVESYGIHRFSTTARLVLSFAVVALVTAAIFALVQMVVAISQGIVLEAESYWGMVAAVLLAVLPATVIGLFSARGITVPIAKVIDTVNAIKGGSYSVRTGFTGYDDIGRLGSTLDEMADTIERNTEYERQITVDVAHELRTPLMAMQANLEGMIDGVLPADAAHLITVNSEVLRLGRLVEGQLKLSRLEARKVEFHPRRLDLGALIGRLVSNYRLLIEGSGLVLDFSTGADVYIYADPDLIRQSAANLISNAIRYTPEGGLLRVQVRKSGLKAELEVSDTGIGIDEADLEKIFSKFWRAKDDRSRDNGGLGIGLATVREIINIHKGSINVQSQLGLGSSFTITLPLSRDA
jgi:signal transduction histidine kinase